MYAYIRLRIGKKIRTIAFLIAETVVRKYKPDQTIQYNTKTKQ